MSDDRRYWALVKDGGIRNVIVSSAEFAQTYLAWMDYVLDMALCPQGVWTGWGYSGDGGYDPEFFQAPPPEPPQEDPPEG